MTIKLDDRPINVGFGFGGGDPFGSLPGWYQPPPFTNPFAPGGALEGFTRGGTQTAAPSAGSNVLSTIGNAAKKVGNWALENPDLILGAIGAWQAAQDQKRANKLRNKAVEAAERDYEERAPFREALLQALASGGLRAPSNPAAPPPDTASRPLVGAEEAARRALMGR